MDEQKKVILKAELSALKGMIPAALAMTAGLQQATYPVAGPMVTIPSLPMAAQAFKVQNDLIAKLATFLEKVIDEM
jgi:hypothetical protein